MIKTTLGGTAALLWGGSRLNAAAQTALGGEVQKLGDDLFIIRIPGEANVIAQTTPNGVALVDGASAAGSDALLKAVSGLPGAGPVRTLFNTHWHPDQTGSNERLAKEGATIIAHENTRLWLTQNVTWPWNNKTVKKLPKAAQPNKTFYQDGKLESGVTYGYIADAAHTDGDLYVFFPNQNVLAVGDAAYGEGWPVVDWWTGGWLGGMVGGLQRLQALGDAQTRIVPARGPVLTMADLRTQANMYSTLYGRLTGMMNDGRGPSEAVQAKPMREYEARMGNSDEFVRRAFESLWAYLSPDA
jgi:glyoxylase-like metal-dependent hydrolase (beta-lactamase superfamily II)